jgi:DNA polymerase-1
LQGSAADLIKIAMVRIHGRQAEHRAKLLLQVHDELVAGRRLPRRKQ